ncbi:replication factor C subunit 1 [Osmerus eperlanus]|uniref:replication factor C subunit 1 n=1 Tax=Osmerus eperlanus TaxID=29151 RepID=UPI002E15DE4D
MDIRRFFAPSKPAVHKPGPNFSALTNDDKKKKIKSVSPEEDVKKKKNITKRTSLKADKEHLCDKKKKKRLLIESDSEEEKPERKTETFPPKKGPVQYISETDSDNDDFLSLKSSKPKENSVAKPTKKKQTENTFLSPKETTKSPPKPTQTRVPVTPTSAPSLPRLTPTSVMDYFGSGGVQRSDRKLVASTKRKAVSQEELSDELLQQMDMEVEKQVHEDEQFAKTLAMLDEEPHAKKARKHSGPHSSSPEKTRADSAHSSTSHSQSNGMGSHKEEVIGPSPKKVLPPKASSKLAMMKRKQEGGERREGVGNVKVTVTPKKEPVSPATTDRKATPKTGSVAGITTSTTLKSSPKKSESTSPEDAEKRRGNSSAFRNYLNREGPRALGSKEIPQGADNCLEGCVFVLTGVLESLEREEAKRLVERYGGKVTSNISRRTSYLVLGRDSGQAKTDKALSLGTQILDEDGLLDLIRTKPGKKSKYEIAAESQGSTRVPLKASPAKSSLPGPSGPQTASPSKTARGFRRALGAGGTPPGRGSGPRRGLEGQGGSPSSSPGSGSSSLADEGASLLWVDRYRPRSLKAVIGQQGEQSCANKLLRWLQNWHRNHAGGGAKPAVRSGKFGSGKDDGSSFKAALLSGPPGVGKTTTAALVCEELGYSYVEMNASCTRSKNSLKELIAESLNNTSIKNYYSGSAQTVSNKHVLIMDEVDGMAGNEDRGGIQEMIGLIKQSKIPIICMCNDRNHQKIRSLANYCYDLRFQRPRLEQIKGAMMSIAFKEGIKILPPALNEIILASNQDIRQVLHNLSMWSSTHKTLSYDQARQDAQGARKDTRLGPFDVCRRVFSSGGDTPSSLQDKSDLFFHDYSLAPLFVQENYPHVQPAAAGGNVQALLVLLSRTADSICDGDLVDRQIRSRQTWSLLPTQAIYASVLPGELMRGYMSQFPSFPSWLGKHSSTSKHSRILHELTSHMSLKTLSSSETVNQDYMPYFRRMLLCPLQRQGAEGAGQAVQLMDQYHLIREDVDSIMEISVWAGQTDPYAKLDPKVKAAFTRAYNREVHLTPYSLQPIKKGRHGGGGGDLQGAEPDSQVPEEDEEEGLDADAMIKQKKAKPIKEPKKEKAGDSGKGKGKGKGRK